MRVHPLATRDLLPRLVARRRSVGTFAARAARAFVVLSFAAFGAALAVAVFS